MSRLINPHVHIKRDLVVGDYIMFTATDANCKAEGTIAQDKNWGGYILYSGRR